MGNLPDAIEAALAVPCVPLWLPDVTDALVKMGQQTLHRHTGITMLHYGTARVLASDLRAPRHVVTCFSFCPGDAAVAPNTLIECLVGDVTRRYHEVGLSFYTPASIVNTPVFNCLQEAIAILAFLPTLRHAVAQLVRVCHLVKPDDDDYDVSYSDPQVPFSIFVSVPQRRRANDALGVAESLVHEAMHLQLTLIEQAAPLVHPSDERYFSPWKGAHRSLQGVLHALYVFRVIDQCLERLLSLSSWSRSSTDYMHQRRREIALQVREIETFKYHTALTALGTRFVQKLIDD
jgi:hypothetical protein